jgi:hypothetical protein
MAMEMPSFKGLDGAGLRERALAKCEDKTDGDEVMAALAEVFFEEIEAGRFKVEHLCVLTARCIVRGHTGWDLRPQLRRAFRPRGGKCARCGDWGVYKPEGGDAEAYCTCASGDRQRRYDEARGRALGEPAPSSDGG